LYTTDITGFIVIVIITFVLLWLCVSAQGDT
jgi:hypothetical protein